MMVLPNHARMFIAVGINDAVRMALTRMQRRLALAQGHVGWTKPENIHCTLLFLGDVPTAEIPAVADAVTAAAADCKRCVVEIAGLGCFGSSRVPRVIWAGVCPAAPLIEMYQQVCRRLPQVGDAAARAKEFHPHLTIGRVRSARNAESLTAAIARNADTVFGALEITEICLMESQLRPDGPVYTLRHKAPFK